MATILLHLPGMWTSLRLGAIGLLGVLVAASTAAAPPPDEAYDYEWTLRGFKGAMARLFVPGRGEGKLTTEFDGDSRLTTELRISSRRGQREDFWLYGAEIDSENKRTLRAWSAELFRGKGRERERDGRAVDALDLASSIYFLRQELPTEAREAKIWSSGEVHPVLIEPTGSGTALVEGARVPTRSYRLQGLRKPGQPPWKGVMDLVLTADERALPVEIGVTRSGMRILLQLVGSQSD